MEPVDCLTQGSEENCREGVEAILPAIQLKLYWDPLLSGDSIKWHQLIKSQNFLPALTVS